MKKAGFVGKARFRAVGFFIGNKGYISTGYAGTRSNDFWEYDTSNNKWSQKSKA